MSSYDDWYTMESDQIVSRMILQASQQSRIRSKFG